MGDLRLRARAGPGRGCRGPLGDGRSHGEADEPDYGRQRAGAGRKASCADHGMKLSGSRS